MSFYISHKDFLAHVEHNREGFVIALMRADGAALCEDAELFMAEAEARAALEDYLQLSVANDQIYGRRVLP